MSLTGFVNLPDVAAKIKLLRPKLPRKIPAPLKVAPRTTNYTIVGTAFDYLLRFELLRRAPHSRSEQLVAEAVPDGIWRPGMYLHLCDAGDMSFEEEEELAKGVAKRARNVVETAMIAIAAYVKAREPDYSIQAHLAGHAIRLAKLDEMRRAGQLNPTFEHADPEDVEDLLALLPIVPFSSLIHPQIMLLNPTFGETSLMVGGADTDFITGDMLVDFKTTKASVMSARDLDRLLGYYLLARQHQRTDSTFPLINRLALYYCRHGYLWVQDATTWTNHPQFSGIEEWFFNHAKQVFRTN
jgi:hypothetical protein